jgi:hypothetical protein
MAGILALRRLSAERLETWPVRNITYKKDGKHYRLFATVYAAT